MSSVTTLTNEDEFEFSEIECEEIDDDNEEDESTLINEAVDGKETKWEDLDADDLDEVNDADASDVDKVSNHENEVESDHNGLRIQEAYSLSEKEQFDSLGEDSVKSRKASTSDNNDTRPSVTNYIAKNDDTEQIADDKHNGLKDELITENETFMDHPDSPAEMKSNPSDSNNSSSKGLIFWKKRYTAHMKNGNSSFSSNPVKSEEISKAANPPSSDPLKKEPRIVLNKLDTVKSPTSNVSVAKTMRDKHRPRVRRSTHWSNKRRSRTMRDRRKPAADRGKTQLASKKAEPKTSPVKHSKSVPTETNKKISSANVSKKKTTGTANQHRITKNTGKDVFNETKVTQPSTVFRNTRSQGAADKVKELATVTRKSAIKAVGSKKVISSVNTSNVRHSKSYTADELNMDDNESSNGTQMSRLKDLLSRLQDSNASSSQSEKEEIAERESGIKLWRNQLNKKIKTANDEVGDKSFSKIRQNATDKRNRSKSIDTPTGEEQLLEKLISLKDCHTQQVLIRYDCKHCGQAYFTHRSCLAHIRTHFHNCFTN